MDVITRDWKYMLFRLIIGLFFSIWIFPCISIASVAIPPQYQLMFQDLSPNEKAKALKLLGRNGSSGLRQEGLSDPRLFAPRSNSYMQYTGGVNNSKLNLTGSYPKGLLPYEYLTSNSQNGVSYRMLRGVEAENSIHRDSYLADLISSDSDALDPFSNLRSFGYDLFASTPTTFAPATDIPIPNEYIVGPGDKFEITLFGKVSAQHSLVVNRDGSINIPKLGLIRVAGLEFRDAREVILSRIKNQQIGVSAAITMGELRSMRVFVLGDAWKPGSYTVSALSTISHAIMMSGGVKESGSLRKIQLKRNGVLVVEFDLYDFLLQGDTSKDLKLLPGDAVFIPPVMRTVSLAGEVNRAAVYELNDEKTLGDIIQLAGGFKPTADKTYIQIQRIESNAKQALMDFDASDAEELNLNVESGDRLMVYSVVEHFEKVVEIKGHVKRERKYQWFRGMTVSDVLGDISIFKDQVDLRYILLKRISKENRAIEFRSIDLVPIMLNPASVGNILLQPRDELTVVSLGENRAVQLKSITDELKYQADAFDVPKLVEVQGAVNNPGIYPFVNGMKLSELFGIVKGYARSELEPYNLFGVIERVDPQTKARSFKTFLPYRVLVNSDDVPLLPGDRVFFFDEEHISYLSSADIHDVLKGEEPSSLKLKGSGVLVTKELRDKTDAILHRGGESGAISIEDGGGLAGANIVTEDQQSSITGLCRGLIQLAEVVNSEGGNRIKRAIATQVTADQLSLKNVMKCPEIYERFPYLLPILMEYVVAVQGESRSPGLYPLAEPLDTGFLIESLGGVTQDGDLTHVEVARARRPDLQDEIFKEVDLVNSSQQAYPGDIISIRPKETLVEKGVVRLIGEFKYPGVYSFKKGETLSELMNRAGGVNKDAYPYGAVFTRESTRKLEQKAFRRAADELNSSLFTAVASGTFKSSGGAGGISMLQSLTKELEETDALGRIVVEADPSILEVKPELDIKLEVGDALFMPKRTRTVSVVGQVLNAGTLLFDPSFDAVEYLEQSGGYNDSADEDRVFVVLPNGTARSLELSWWGYKPTNIPPGSTIIVPRDTRPVNWLLLTQSVTDIASKLAITAASLATLSSD